MTTSFVVVACTSDKRWFDLDAVRYEPTNRPQRCFTPSYSRGGQGSINDRPPLLEPSNRSDPAGAPPLDWHDDCDPPPPPKEHPMSTTTITVHRGDVRNVMAAMPDNSVDLLVTSPPFLALRSYLPADHPDKPFEIGSEATPAAFLDTMLELSAEWRRIVVGSGSIAVEIGDTYSGSGGAGGDYGDAGLRKGQPTFQGSAKTGRHHPECPPDHDPKTWRPIQGFPIDYRQGGGPGWPLAKSLCMIPELYGVALAYGLNPVTGTPSPAGRWRIRNWLTWTRPNPPVGALGDKFRPATSFVTVACVSDKRWFDLDAVRGEPSPNTHARVAAGRGDRYDLPSQQRDGNWSTLAANNDANPAGAPPLDWHDDDWQPLHRLPTAPYAGAHYATYPIALPTKLIEAMCPREVCVVCGEARRRMVGDTPEYAAHKAANTWGTGGLVTSNLHRPEIDFSMSRVATLGWTDCGHDNYRPGVVFDPFAGSGTTLLAAALTGRDAIGIDLDESNLELIRQRIGEAVLIVRTRYGHTGGQARTIEQGRAGYTPVTATPWLRPTAAELHPLANRITFTVNRHMPGVKGEHPDQLNLFAEVAS